MDGCQHFGGELAANHGGEPQHFLRVTVQTVQAAADDRLDGSWEIEAFQRASEDRAPVMDLYGPIF